MATMALFFKFSKYWQAHYIGLSLTVCAYH